MAKDIQKKVRNTIFLYFLKHILYIRLPEQPHIYGSDFQNHSTLILYFSPGRSLINPKVYSSGQKAVEVHLNKVFRPYPIRSFANGVFWNPGNRQGRFLHFGRRIKDNPPSRQVKG